MVLISAAVISFVCLCADVQPAGSSFELVGKIQKWFESSQVKSSIQVCNTALNPSNGWLILLQFRLRRRVNMSTLLVQSNNLAYRLCLFIIRDTNLISWDDFSFR